MYLLWGISPLALTKLRYALQGIVKPIFAQWNLIKPRWAGLHKFNSKLKSSKKFKDQRLQAGNWRRGTHRLLGKTMRHAKQFKVSRRKFGGRLHRSLLGCYYRLTYLPDSRARIEAVAGAALGVAIWLVGRGSGQGERLLCRVPECSAWTARALVSLELLLLLLRQFAEAEMETEGVRWRHVKIFSKVNATKRTKAQAKRETRFQLRLPTFPHAAQHLLLSLVPRMDPNWMI